MSGWARRMEVLKPRSSPPRRITLKVTQKKRKKSVTVVADASGVVSHAGGVLLADLADRLGLTAGCRGGWQLPVSAARSMTRGGCCAMWR